MARFYKTASANPTDYMYRIPSEMMLRVLQGNEMQVDDIMNKADLYNNTLLQVPYLTQHAEDVKKKQDYYNSKTTEISKSILQDPLAWRKYQGTIKDLGKELQEDMLTGDLSKIQGSYKTLQEFNKKYQKALDKGEIDRKEYEAILNAQLSNFTGYDETGKISSLNLEEIANTYNLPVYFDKLIKGLKADGQLDQRVNMGDLYKTMQEVGWEGLKTDKVFGVLYNKIMGDPALWNSINQRVKYNVPGYQGVYGEDGTLQLMKPVEKERQVMGNDGKMTTEKYTTYEPYNNIVSNAFFGTVEGASFMKTKNRSDISANPYGLQTRAFGQQERMANIQNKFKIDAENRQRERDNLKSTDEREKENRKFAENYAKELMNSDNPEDVTKGKQIYEDLMNGRPLSEIGNLPSFLTEINNPDATFAEDLQSVNMNRKSSNTPDDGGSYITATPGTLAFTQQTRMTESINYADREFNKKYSDNPLAMEYRNFIKYNLEEFNSDPEGLAKRFLETKGIYQKNGSYAQDFWNNQRKTSWLQDDNAKKWTQMYNVGEEYKSHIDKKYSDINASNIKVQVSPMDNTTNLQVNNIIKTTPEYYFATDVNGNPLEMSSVQHRDRMNNITKILGVTGGNNQSNLGYYVEYSNGEKGFVFPKNDPNVIRANMYYSAKGINDKNSYVYNEMNNSLTNDVKTQLSQGTYIQGLKIGNKNIAPGHRNVITLGNIEYLAILHSNGSVTLIDEDGNNSYEYPDIRTLVEQSLKN